MRRRELVIYIILMSIKIFGSDYTLQDLETLRERNRITAEEYEILKSELEGVMIQDGDMLYSATINRRYRTNMFKIMKKNGKNYFPIFNFFKTIQFKNYEINKGKLIITLGKSLDKVELNLDKGELKISKINESLKFTPEQIYSESSEIYVDEEIFKKMFTTSMEVDDQKFTAKINLYFETPYEINNILDNRFDKNSFGKNKNELLYTNQNKFFDLGYTLLNLRAEMNKNNGEKFREEFKGEVEYQGNFLYGDLVTSYDINENNLGTTYIYYPEIYKNHSLEVGSYGDKQREMGFTLKKERGYFYDDKEIVIRENVPVGSRVELLYLGFPIDVQEEENGSVEFRSNDIRRGRNYILRVYTPDGKIYDIDIDTTIDFRLQNKGEFEYDIYMRENHNSKKTDSSAKIYYGLTENFTIGGGARKEVEEEDKNYSYRDYYDAELVYSNSILRVPYTLVLGKEIGEEGRGSDYLEGRIEKNNLSLYTKHTEYGSYYDEKRDAEYGIEYNSSRGYTIDTNYYITEYNNKERENDYDIGFSFNKSLYEHLMTTAEYRTYKESGDEYRLNLYYTGFHYVNSSLKNTWSDDGKNYSTILSLSNKNLWDNVDFTLEFSYSSREESRFTLKFDLIYDRWFRAGVDYSDGGSQKYRAGIYKVVDLKDISKNIESMDSSRVKVLTFVDTNGNNIYDKDEKVVDNVEVKIGSQTEVTGEDGIAYFYGVPNGILYDLKPKIRKPAYSIGDNKIGIRGKSTGTVEAFIPVKPMVTLSGVVVIDQTLNFTDIEKMKIHENTIIRIKDMEGNVIDNAIPDEQGIFYVSGLFPEKYTLDILYIGKEMEIPEFTEEIKLVYSEDKENHMVLKFEKNGLALLSK